MVTNTNFNEVNSALEEKKRELNLTGEIKWTKTSVAYLDKYKQMMDLFFSFVKQNKVKLRIMFQESGHSYAPLHQDHIAYLQNLWQFRKARIIIRHDDIAEIDSHKHSIQQCMDIVLGAMAFRLNNKHLEIPPGATEPGHKTKAKETLFNHILELIKDADGITDFDITKTTLPDRARDRWIIPYRHWKFLAAEFKQKKD